MKFLYLFLGLILSNAGFAHQDHMLGEGALHFTYHVVFWTLFVCVVYKALTVFINARKNRKS